MDILKYKGYEGTAELDMSRGVCRGKVLFIKDLVTYESESPARLQQEFEAAIDDYLATCVELSREPAKPFRGQFNIRIAPELHRSAALRAAEDGVCLNDIVVKALDAFLSISSEINHNHHLRVTIAGEGGQLKSFTSVASEEPKWNVVYAH